MRTYRDGIASGILLACMPKSGSSSLSSMIARLDGVRVAHLVPGFDIREQEIDIKILERQLSKNAMDGGTFVAQTHVVRSGTTQRLIDSGAVTPIVQTRNLPDALVSCVDHLMRYHDEGLLIPRDFRSWPFEAQADFIIRFNTPWYLKFHKSWIAYADFADVWVRYEDMRADPTETLRRVASRLRLTGNFEDAVTNVRARYNKGVNGRGKELLTEAQLGLIAEMVDLYEFPPEHRAYLLTGNVLENAA